LDESLVAIRSASKASCSGRRSSTGGRRRGCSAAARTASPRPRWFRGRGPCPPPQSGARRTRGRRPTNGSPPEIPITSSPGRSQNALTISVKSSKSPIVGLSRREPTEQCMEPTGHRSVMNRRAERPRSRRARSTSSYVRQRTRSPPLERLRRRARHNAARRTCGRTRRRWRWRRATCSSRAGSPRTCSNRRMGLRSLERRAQVEQ
jgi:hypothetical protein